MRFLRNLKNRQERWITMWIIDLYMENSGKSRWEKDEWYGYVLSYQGQTLQSSLGNY